MLASTRSDARCLEFAFVLGLVLVLGLWNDFAIAESFGSTPSMVMPSVATASVVTASVSVSVSSLTDTASSSSARIDYALIPSVDTATAAPHDQVSGLIDPMPESDPELLPRALFFLPRWALTAAFAPARGALWLVERYQIPDRLEDFFFDDTDTFGAYPIASFESGFGIDLGATAEHRNLFGHQERLKVSAAFGGRYRQRYLFSLDSGALVSDRASFRLSGGFEAIPAELFFGIGNTSRLSPPEQYASMRIDPYRDPIAVQTAFARDAADVRFEFSARLASIQFTKVFAKGTASWRYNRFSPLEASSPEVPVAQVYAPESFVYSIGDLEENDDDSSGHHAIYGEFELQIDSRRPKNKYIPQSTPSEGWLVRGFVGVHGVFDDTEHVYPSYGAEVTHLIDVFRGDRVLLFRAQVESILGAARDIPVLDLPSLGGPTLLRGYARNRFRDRALVLFTAEYLFPLNAFSRGFVFADTGRVLRTLEDFALEDFRATGGLGVEVFSPDATVLRFFVSLTDRKDLFFSLVLDPVYELPERARR